MISAGGDVDDLVTGFVSDKGQRARLGGGHFARRNPHAQHVAIVIGLAPEDAVPLQPLEIGLIDLVVAGSAVAPSSAGRAIRRSRAFWLSRLRPG